MAPIGPNKWLDVETSDDDAEDGYDSEAQEEVRGGRATKRRRLSLEDSRPPDDQQELDDEDEASFSNPADSDHELQKLRKISMRETFTERPKSTHADSTAKRKSSNSDSRTSSKTGVVYLSRIPPFMKPSTLKSLFSPYGEIGKVFLTPEDASVHNLRVKTGGNKKRSFTDGWVEFIHKRDAKLVVETLNAQTIGGKKGGWYRDDVWNIKYLRGFKWHHLTEQIANENAERAARLRAEISQTAKENNRFIANVEKAKMLEGMQAKRMKREAEGGSLNAAVLESRHSASAVKDGMEVKRVFRQNEVKKKVSDVKQSEEVNRVLSKIF